MKIDVDVLKRKVEENTDNMVKFLRDLVALPSSSSEEKEVALRIKKEMEDCGFDEVFIDDYGSVIGRMGSGKPRILYDGHIDTVDVGDPSKWDFDPFKGKLENGFVWGRGASDNKAAPVVQIYGMKILREMIGDQIPGTVFVVGTVQEESCDGLALEQVIQNDRGGDIDCVGLGECTNCGIYRGHRGRIELALTTSGVSSHASAPERGENAIYKMSAIVKEIEQLNERLKKDEFLGKGTVAVTKIKSVSDSLNCVPYSCQVHIDRRLTEGETREIAIKEITDLPSFKDAKVEVLEFSDPSYTGKTLTTEKYYPSWTLPEDHAVVQSAANAYRNIFEENPVIDKWTFSTNGVSSMGKLGIPTIGFGPSEERFAHTTEDKCSVEHLKKACMFYAGLSLFMEKG